MRDKLKTYIDYLFAGAPQTAATAETKAEILQNTLDKYDDLIAEGKTPEAAYSLAVSGIGDLGAGKYDRHPHTFALHLFA